MTTTYTTAHTDAEAGARILDAERPGWAESINLAHLDMDSLDNCILGQVFEADFVKYLEENIVFGTNTVYVSCPYRYGLWKLTGTVQYENDDFQLEHGFLVHGRTENAELRDAWTDQVLLRT